jgi:L-aminopeptidase/D-esterase-like protein
MPGAITDIAGLTVGHHTLSGRATGCTVVLCPDGAVAGVDVRGGAPGTRETDLLRPQNLVQEVHAVLLTGGSAFGLAAADGVMRWLEDHGHGLPVGPARVPIVPAAVIFDLWQGDPSIRPTAESGYAACVAATASAPAQGAVGAGAGARVGKLWGAELSMPGGLGTASIRVGDITVAALMVVNAIGDVLDADGTVLAGARHPQGGLRRSMAALVAGDLPARMTPGTATTIGVVATTATLDKSQATAFATLSHAGLPRAVEPLTQFDGDTLFALATGRGSPPADISLLGALGARVVAEAIRNAVRP